MRQMYVCALVCLVINSVVSHPLTNDVSESPLFLTPYIEKGDITGGQAAAKVPSLIQNEDILSYSGYLTVNSTYNSNLFFWFFPAENSQSKAPLLLWLTGGPGVSSLVALFAENGPFSVNKDLTLTKRSHYWSQSFNLIYIDNPVGTGFSFTENELGYAKDEVQIGNQLYSAMYQFLQLFPEYKDRDFYITGESYAGKYVPALGYAIHTKNPTAPFPIKLKGLAIGDGWIDPINQQQYSDYLFQIGLIDDKVKNEMKIIEMQCIQLIKEEKYTDAVNLCGDSLGLYDSATGLDVFNYAHMSVYDPRSLIKSYVIQPKLRISLHVGNQTFDDGGNANSALLIDAVQSVAPWLELLMDNYRVVLYNGQLDVTVAYPLTMNMVRNLKWKGATDYSSAKRKLWKVNNKPAGFFKTSGNFTEVLVRNAGHMVPTDQPVRALDLITRFVNNVPFDYEFS